MKFFKDSLIALTGQWVIIILTFLVNIVVARMAGPEGKGLYTLLVMSGSFIILVVNLGLSRAAIYYIGTGTYSIQQMVNHVWTLTVLIGFLSALTITSILLYTNYQPIEGVPVSHLVIIVLSAPFLLGNLSVGDIFLAVEKFVWMNTAPFINSICNLILLPLLLYMQIGDIAFPLAIAGSALISCSIGWYVIRQQIGTFRFQLELSIVKDLTSYGIRAYSYAITTFLNLRLDQFIIGFLISVPQVGIYSIAVAISELAFKISRAITAVLFPRISASTHDAANLLTGRISRLSLAVTFIFTIVVALVGKYFISIVFGDEFEGAYIPLMLLLPGILAFNILQILSTDLSGRGRPEIGTYSTFVGIFITILGNWFLTPKYGISGAAATASFAYIISALVTTYVYLQVSGQSLFSILFVSRQDLFEVGRIMQRFLRPGLDYMRS